MNLVRFLYPFFFFQKTKDKKTAEIVENIESGDSDNEDIAAAEEAVVDDQVEQDNDGHIEIGLCNLSHGFQID